MYIERIDTIRGKSGPIWAIGGYFFNCVLLATAGAGVNWRKRGNHFWLVCGIFGFMTFINFLLIRSRGEFLSFLIVVVLTLVKTLWRNSHRVLALVVLGCMIA